MRYEIFIKKIRNFDCELTMQSVITGNLFQNFKITHFGEKNIMPIGTCMQLLVNPLQSLALTAVPNGISMQKPRKLSATAQQAVRPYQVPYGTPMQSA